MSRAKSWPPIISADGDAIEEGMLIYEPDTALSKYDSRRERHARVNVYRVTLVDLRYRTIRARCVKGCETVWEYNKGCSRKGIHTKLQGAVHACKEQIKEQVVEILKDVKNLQDSAKHIAELKVTATKVPAPHVVTA